MFVRYVTDTTAAIVSEIMIVASTVAWMPIAGHNIEVILVLEHEVA